MPRWSDAKLVNGVYTLAYGFKNFLPQFTPEVQRDAYRAAAAGWCAVANLDIRETLDLSKADIVISADGAGQPWSASMQPYGSDDSQIRTDFNPNPPGTYSLDQESSNVFSYRAAAGQEMGNTLGLDETQAPADALMSKYQKGGVYLPTAWDIAAIQALYGPPKGAPTVTDKIFDGVKDYLQLDAAQFGSFGSPVSFETWFNAAPGSSGVILGQVGPGPAPGGTAPAGYVPALAIGTDGRIRSSLFWHDDVNARNATLAAFYDGAWHHVAVTWQSGVERLYVDGALVGSRPASQTPYASSYSYYLGTGFTKNWAAGNGGWHFFKGTLRNWAGYSRELTAAEIAQHYAAGVSTPSNPPDFSRIRLADDAGNLWKVTAVAPAP